MSENSDFMEQNKAFLSLAGDFGLYKSAAETSSINSNLPNNSCEQETASLNTTNTKDYELMNEVVIDLLQLQEKIGKLQMNKKLQQMSDEYAGMTSSKSLKELEHQLNNLSKSLSFIVDNSAKIQLKLANPSISNSFPLHSSLHDAFIRITEELVSITATSDRIKNSSSWLNTQDWEEIRNHLSSNKDFTEKLVGKLRTSFNKIQTYKEQMFN